MALAGIAMALFGTLRALAPSYEPMLALQLLFGLGYAGIIPWLPKLISELFREGEVGFATGIYTSGLSLGVIAGYALTAWLLDVMDWRSVLWIYGLGTALLVASWIALAKEPTVKRAKRSLLEDLVAASKTKSVWILTGIFLCAVATHDTLLVWLPTIFESKGASTVEAGILASALPLGSLLAGPISGRWSDKVGSRKAVLLSLGFLAGPALAFIALAPIELAWLASLLLGFCTMGILTMVFAVLSEQPEMTHRQAGAAGIVTSVGNAGLIAMPIFTGYVHDATGSFLPAIIMLLFVVEGAPLLGLRLKEARSNKPEETSCRPRLNC